MEVFFSFGFGQLIAQDLYGSQAVEETNVTPALDCFQSHSGRLQRHVGSIKHQASNLAEVSSVHAGGRDSSLPLAGHHVSETVNHSLVCSALFPACKGVNLSASTRKSSVHSL